MGRRRGEEKRTCKAPVSCNHGGPTPIARGNEDGAGGGLPLFYATSPKLTRSRAVGRIRRIAASPLQRKVDNRVSRREVSADVHLGDGDPVWPPRRSRQSQELASWASSFRFDLDAQDAETLLERERTETPGGSFRFRSGTEEEPSGNLPHHDAEKFPAPPDGLEKHGERVDAALQPSVAWDVVKFEARRSVAVDVPNSPERDEVLRRLHELKAAHPSASPILLRFGLGEVASPSLLRLGSPILADVATYHKEMARRDHLHQRLKADSCKSSSCTSPASKKDIVPEIAATLGELEIMPITVERRRLQSASSPSRTAAPSAILEVNPIKQSPRRSSSCSIQDQIASIRGLHLPAKPASHVSSIPSPDHTPFLSAARGRIPFKWEEEPGKPKTIAHAQRVSQEQIEVSNCMENSLQQEADEDIIPEVEVSGGGVGSSDGGRDESHRYYGRAHLRGYSESSLGQSSRRHGTHERLEAQIDLDASAAAKFLVELYDTPLSTPGRHGSSPTFAVPFKWEDVPGVAKVETPAGRPNMLQLPPRLAVPSYRNAERFSRELRASHPLAGFFAPCLRASSSGHRQSDRMMVQYSSSKGLPPRPPSSPRRRQGLVGRCHSTPREGCQIRVSKSPVLQALDRDIFNESSSSSSSSSKPDAAPPSPRSILCGPDEGSSSQTSASNVFSSGDLEDFTQQTNRSAPSASKSSNSSFESIEEDFAESPSLETSHPDEPQKSCPHAMKDSPLAKSVAERQGQEDRRHSKEPAPWSPALASHFQSLETPPTPPTELPLAPKAALPTLQSLLQQEDLNASAPASPTRLPSVADQLLASRRQLSHDVSPRVRRQHSGQRLHRSSHAYASPAPRVERYEVSQTPPATFSHLLLSPPANLAPHHRRKGLATAKLPLPARPRRRARFMVSICKSLKRLILGKQPHGKTTKLTYAIAP